MANNVFKSNLYHKPGQAMYQSQFVPMPLDFMAKQLAGRQKAQDEAQKQLDLEGEWDQAALGWHDKKYVQDIKNKNQAFIDEWSGKDMSGADFRQAYTKHIRSVKNDPNLKKVKAAVDTHQQNLEWLEKLKATDYGYAMELADEYDRALQIYTMEGGKGFAGAVKLADPLIQKGLNIQKEKEEYFNHIGEDSYQKMRALSAQGPFYSTTTGGKSKGKLQNASVDQFEGYYGSNAGRQMQSKFKSKFIPRTDENGRPITQQQYLNSLSDDERAAFNTKMKNWVFDDFFKTGQTFATSKYETTEATAQNKLWDRAEDAKDKVTYQPMFHEYDEASSETTHIADIETRMDETRQRMVEQANLVAGLPEGPQKDQAMADLKAINTEFANYTVTLDKEKKKLNDEYQRKIDRSSFSYGDDSYLSNPLKKKDNADKLAREYITKNIYTIGTSEGVRFKEATLKLSEDKDLANALFQFERGGIDLTYGDIQNMFDEMGVDYDVAAKSSQALGSKLSLTSQGGNSGSVINFWRTELIRGAANKYGSDIYEA
jgi:hypothetical protein